MILDFSCPAGKLREALLSAQAATGDPGARAKVLLSVTAEGVRVVGTSSGLRVTTQVEASQAKEGRAVVVSGPLASYLGTLGAQTVVRVFQDGTSVRVAPTGRPSYRFQSPGEAYPGQLVVAEPDRHWEASRFAAALAAVRSAVPKDASMVRVTADPAKGLILDATDHQRVARAVLPEAGFGPFTGVLSLYALDQVAKAAATAVAVDARGRLIRFSGPNVSVTIRVLSAVFPAVENALAHMPDHTARVETVYLREVLPSLGSVAGHAPLECVIDQDRMTLSVENTGSSEGAEEIPVRSRTAAPFRVRLSHTLLTDAVAAHTAEVVTLGWGTVREPFRLEARVPFPVTVMLMPMA